MTITPPWTAVQVDNLNRYQAEGRMHPFTCGNAHHVTHQILIATEDGWRCPDETCDYHQKWAHAFVAADVSRPQIFNLKKRTPADILRTIADKLMADSAPTRTELKAYATVLLMQASRIDKEGG